MLVLTGCGGRAHSTDLEGTGGASSSGGAASSGAAAGGRVGQPEHFVLDDNHPWFDGSGNIGLGYGEGDGDKVLHVNIDESPARATLSTHNIFDLLSAAHEVRFSARASAPLRLLVSASHTIQEYDYFAARDAGARWPLASVEVGVEWQHFSVLLADMQPPEMQVEASSSFFLAFIVEHPTAVQVWFDDVWFE